MDIFTHNRIGHYFLLISAIIIFGGASLILYLVYIDGSNPIEIKNSPVQMVEPEPDKDGNPIPKKIFKTGEDLTFLIDYCKNRSTPARVYGAYIDTVKIEMPVVEVNAQKGCDKRISSFWRVPAILPSGVYHFEVTLVYQVNPLRSVSVNYRTENFIIVNSKK